MITPFQSIVLLPRDETNTSGNDFLREWNQLIDHLRGQKMFLIPINQRYMSLRFTMNPQSEIFLIHMNGLRGNPPMHMISDKIGKLS